MALLFYSVLIPDIQHASITTTDPGCREHSPQSNAVGQIETKTSDQQRQSEFGSLAVAALYVGYDMFKTSKLQSLTFSTLFSQ